MKKITALVGVASTVLVGSVSAQTFAFVGEVDALLSFAGTPVNTTTVNGFYAVVPGATDVAADFSSFTWSPLVIGTPVGGDYMTPTAPSLLPIAVGSKPVFAFVTSADVGSLGGGDEYAVLEAGTWLSSLDNTYITIASENYSVVYGTDLANKVGMVAVPEPSTFALLGGVLALGFVMYRRRRA